jgi:hypothetical protein
MHKRQRRIRHAIRGLRWNANVNERISDLCLGGALCKQHHSNTLGCD